MPTRRRDLELSVERPLSAASGTVARLTAKVEGSGPEGAPTTAELRAALEQLAGDLDAAAGGPLPARPDRDLDELVETYRPRQRDLVDLLLSDGELTVGEHARLVQHLTQVPPPPTAPFRPPPATPMAAAPVAADPSLPPARPVAELLKTYQIESLKQAGAVRARRQISFAEYMALKRHFDTARPDAATAR